jgi:hypothetical protein
MVRYHRTSTEQFLDVTVAVGWSIYTWAKHHNIIHCTAWKKKKEQIGDVAW